MLNERFILPLSLTGKRLSKLESNLFPSLRRKNVINSTDKIPMLKLPIWEIIELKSLVTKLKSTSDMIFKSDINSKILNC